MEKMVYGKTPEEYAGYDNSKVVILPIPYDGTSTWMKGADKGPEAIIEASGHMELYDIDTDSEVYTIGLHTADPVSEDSSPEAMVNAAYSRALSLIRDKKFVVSIGGEHSVSIGPMKAHAESFKDLTILQFDAHTDLRQEYEGSKYNHACVMARAREWCPYVQVGIRSIDIEELPYIRKERIFYARDIRAGINPGWIDDVIEQLSSNVYMTIDLDGFDPSIMPSTGTPEPGGLYYYDLINLIEKLNRERNIVGFDVVELCPNPKIKAPDFLASKLIYQIISMKFNKK
jgi:agmatinase